MIPTTFPQANIDAGEVATGSLEGAPIIVTAWQPSPAQIEDIVKGAPVFIAFIGMQCPMHLVTTSFASAINPA